MNFGVNQRDRSTVYSLVFVFSFALVGISVSLMKREQFIIKMAHELVQKIFFINRVLCY